MPSPPVESSSPKQIMFAKPFSRPKSLESVENLQSVGTDPVTATNIVSTSRAHQENHHFCFEEEDYLVGSKVHYDLQNYLTLSLKKSPSMPLMSYRDEPQMFSSSSSPKLSIIENLKRERSKSQQRRTSSCLAALTNDLIVQLALTIRN